MAELLVRFSGPGAALLERVAGPRRPPGPGLTRVVLDAHTASRDSRIAMAARRLGLPVLIDPQTFYLQDHQHPADPWALLPFGSPHASQVADLMSPARQDQLVADCLEFQLDAGATSLIPPYVHIDRAGDGWADVQANLFRRTRRYLDQQDIHLPLTAIVAVSWRLTGRISWHSTLDHVLAAVNALAPAEVALAASKIDQGVHPDRRLAQLYAAIDLISNRHGYPTVAWNQGILGEAAVAAGAIGYETGIGWRERCDIRARMSNHHYPHDHDSGFGPRPVYIAAAGRSLPKRSVNALLTDSVVGPRLICTDFACCPTGREVLRGDARAHAITARARRLALLAANAHPRWAWTHLAQHAEQGLNLAERINILADRQDEIARVDTRALSAIATTANVRRHSGRRHHAA
jgi:hypothetical protein